MANAGFYFNPFSGLSPDEISQTIVPRFELLQMKDLLESESSLILEFVGKKGRGKTTHLTALHELLPQAPIFYLSHHNRPKDIINSKSDIVFIDSIHHLDLFQRWKVYRSFSKIVLTSHYSRTWEYLLIKKPFKKVPFNGLNAKQLKRMIDQRLALASRSNSFPKNISIEDAQKLIHRFGDDHRAIMNHLFDQFQTQSSCSAPVI